MRDITDWLHEIDERITDAVEEHRESHAKAMNSYGAGWDAGYLDGLREAKSLLVDIDS